jgi:hypothetical protein
MQWLRDWFCKGRALPARHRRTHTLRPTLEQLEGRVTPSIAGAVSSVNDNMGNSVTFAVHQDGTLWGQFNGSQFVQVSGESNVKSVSAGMDNQGLADAFVVHNDGSLTLQTAKTLVARSPGIPIPLAAPVGISKVVAEAAPLGTQEDYKALVIDNNGFLWQFEANDNLAWSLPVGTDGMPEFPGSQDLGFLFSLLDANVSQATLLKDVNGTDTVIAMHTDGTLWSDLAPMLTNAGTLQDTQIATGIASISSVIARGNPFQNFLFTVSSNGDLQQQDLVGNSLMTVQDFGGASGFGGSGSFNDVNVGWNGGNFVATTNTGQVFLFVATMTNTDQVFFTGQLIDSQYAVNSAFAGPGGSFYAVTTSGALNQWSPDLYYGLVPADANLGFFSNGTWNWAGGVNWQLGWTHWTELDSNVSLS